MADLTQDQILAQLQTRGFEEGFQTTPLRDFWGKLTDIGGEMKEGQRGPYLVILYNFEEVEVIETTEPYTTNIAQIPISHSNRSESRMGYFGASVDAVINVGVAAETTQDQVKNQDYLVGKTIHMKYTGGHMVWNVEAKERRPISCWVLIEVRGEGAPAAAQVAATPTATAATPTTPTAGGGATAEALKILDGKTESQWHQEVFVNTAVKADPAIVNSIIGRTFLEPLMAAGIVTIDDDKVYHVNQT